MVEKNISNATLIIIMVIAIAFSFFLTLYVLVIHPTEFTGFANKTLIYLKNETAEYKRIIKKLDILEKQTIQQQEKLENLTRSTGQIQGNVSKTYETVQKQDPKGMMLTILGIINQIIFIIVACPLYLILKTRYNTKEKRFIRWFEKNKHFIIAGIVLYVIFNIFLIIRIYRW